MKRMGFLAVATTAALLSGASVWAEHEDDDRWRDDRYGDWRGRAARRGGFYGGAGFEIGFEKGYEEGLEHGRKDGDRGRDFNYAHDNKYRKGDHGYRSSYGSRSQYVRGFRQGYEEGYRDGYEAYFGYRDGHRRGGRIWDGWLGRYRYGTRNDSRYGQIYDWQRDGRHRHYGRDGWCRDRHSY